MGRTGRSRRAEARHRPGAPVLERCADSEAHGLLRSDQERIWHRYADFGLTFVKLGEEAKVDLTTFTLEGGQAAKHRQVLRRLERDGGVFRIIEPAGVPAIMPELRAVSDDWLAVKAGAEKGFSLGFFDEEYLSRFPIAVIERDGQIQAFANLWLGPQRVEMSVDLMRYHQAAPKGVMETLLVYLMRWGKQQGYRWFVLGMAPLSGFEQSPVAPLWNRIGAFLYEHGEAVYNFRGCAPTRRSRSDVGRSTTGVSGGLRLRASWQTCRRWSLVDNGASFSSGIHVVLACQTCS